MSPIQNPLKWRGKLRWKLRVARSLLAHRRARRKLISMLPKRGVGVEVGVWKGDHAAKLLALARPSKLYLVDPWLHIEHDGAKYQQLTQDEMDAIHQAVVERFRRQMASDRVVVLRNDSLGAIPELPQLDWAYIDGDHMYDAVIADLRAYWDLLKDGGCLAGDDYDVKGWWDNGVKKAVDEFCAEHACDARMFGSQFVIRKVAVRT